MGDIIKISLTLKPEDEVYQKLLELKHKIEGERGRLIPTAKLIKEIIIEYHKIVFSSQGSGSDKKE